MHRKLIYQSILNTTEPRRLLPAEVTLDLRLDTMLSGRASEVVRRPASPQDLPLRQELIGHCSDGYLSELLVAQALLGRIERLYQRLDTTECEDELNALSVCIFKAELEFLRLGAELNRASAANNAAGEAYNGTVGQTGHTGSVLLDRFSAHCTELLGFSEYTDIANELKKLDHGADAVYRCDVTANTAYISHSSGEQTDIFSRLRTLASGLGIEVDSVGERSYPPLGEGFISTFALLDRECYAGFERFAERHRAELDRSILEYIPELDFLISISSLMSRVRSAGIPLCMPSFSESGGISADSAYDITLLEKQDGGIIPNDIEFTERERIFYLTGANGGGKTTYLRTVGNLVLLALSGAPVPSRSATVPMLGAVYTHFPRDERFGGGGRFSDEEARADEIAKNADAESLVLLNETYSTTGEEKAKHCTASLAHTLLERGCYCIYVTHQKPEDAEIPVLGVVLAEDGESRTYKIRRTDGGGSSHALDILKKYRLDRNSLAERFVKK